MEQNVGYAGFTPKSYSQLEQDIEVVRHYHHCRDGYFVDVGAFDGKTFSNTLLLELMYGWNGLCIEPNPRAYYELRRNRSAICYNVAVDFISGYKDFYVDPNQPMLSKFGVGEITPTMTLQSLLDESLAPKFIHYLSLDTEGSELAILQSVNLKDYCFGVIHVESNYEEDKKRAINDYLKYYGYLYKKDIAFDMEFIYCGGGFKVT